uniref:Uncharacterized protein n=1 Tax=Ascaris lumbricoides TaxID=6252 RepID=A0A0M3HT03_ASCLU
MCSTSSTSIDAKDICALICKQFTTAQMAHILTTICFEYVVWANDNDAIS